MKKQQNKYTYKVYSYRSLLFLFCLFLLTPSWATKNHVLSPLPSAVVEKWRDFEFVGQTSLRRFGIHIYDSSFWMIDKKSPVEPLSTSTFALSITYARKVRMEQLLSSTKKEWLRLGYADRYPIEAWLLMLSNIWTDVRKGDQLVLISDMNGSSMFYNKEQRIGTIDDPQFGSAFLSIWLDENARFKKNRRELLGE